MPKNRVREVILREGHSDRVVQLRCGLSCKELHELTKPNKDLTISQLQMFSAALEVPIAELVEDVMMDEVPRLRGALLRILKIANYLEERIAEKNKTLTESIRNIVLDMVPEFEKLDTPILHTFGVHRGFDELGRAAHFEIPIVEFFREARQHGYTACPEDFIHAAD